MKSLFTMYVYKRDARTKSGERLVSTQVFTDKDVPGNISDIQDLCNAQGFRFECVPIGQGK